MDPKLAGARRHPATGRGRRRRRRRIWPHAIHDGAIVGTGGFIEEGGQRFNIRHVQPIVDPEQIGKIPVIERGGKVIRMADLGQVVIDPGPMIGDGVVDDGPGLLLVVQSTAGEHR